MFSRGMLALVWILAVAIAVSASITWAADDSGTIREAPDVQPQQAPVETIDDVFAGVAEQAPGFGGAFYDSAGRLTVYLQNAGQRGAAEAALRSDLGADRVGAEPVRVLLGQYDYRQLKDWYDRMTEVLAIPGVLETDIEESKNRLRVGVEQLVVRAAVTQRLDNLGIPRAAVDIVQTEPVERAATLDNLMRPLRGGVRIQPAFGGNCTLGFNAIHAIEGAGFVTNSHCTRADLVVGGLDNTIFHQDVVGNPVGIEKVDRDLFVGGACPATRKCRYSDSAFIKRDDGVKADLGIIAKTTQVSPNDGSGDVLTLHTTERFNIVGTVPFPIEGETLNKVGRTTGWTQGTVPVAGTCVKANQAPNETLICQDRVTARSVAGDSGSPVFKVTNSPNPNDVKLYGILWSTGPPFLFSRIGQVESAATELGPLTVFGSVGGVAEVPDAAVAPVAASDSAGPGAGTLAGAILAAAVAGALALGGAGWWRRRRGRR